MLVQMHTNFCLLCVLTFLFHQCHRCHEQTHHKHSHPHPPHNDSDLQLHQSPQEAEILEEEQQFYIQQLFRRYGQKDRLDFNGFQSLLFSLGLGEVKLVEVDHEDLGHDHVAHLDILDLQEGLHSHSATEDGHAHGHHKHESHGANTEQAPTKCTRQTTAASPSRGTAKDQESGLNRGRKVDQDGHKHFHEDHKDVTLQHEHDSGQNGEKVEAGDAHKELYKELKNPNSHSHHDHDHEGHEHGTDSGQNGGGIKAEEDKKQNGTQGKESKNEEDLVLSPSQHEHNHSGHDGHIREKHTRQNGGRLEVESGHEEHKNHDSHLHHEHGHKHDSGQNGGRIEAEPEHKHPHGRDSQSHHEHDQTSTVSAPVLDVDQIKPSQPAPTESKPKKHKKTTRGKGQRGRSNSHDQEQGPSGAHKSKREVPGGNKAPTAPAPLAPGHPSGASHQHEECLNLTQLLTYYGLSADSLISPVQFTYLCPALLYQIDSRVCIRHYHQVEVDQEALQPASSVWVWLWGFVSITIISLLSLLGVVLVPIMDQDCFKFMLTFLVALAVGTLSGDALLHLLPHSQGEHDHSQDSSGNDSHTNFDSIWKGLTALAGIYLLFIIEHCLGMFKHYKDQKAMAKDSEEGTIGRKLSDHKLNRRSDAEWLHLKPLNEDPDSVTVCDNGHSDTQLTEIQTPESSLNQTQTHSEPPSPKKNGQKSKPHRHGHGHSHGGNCHSDQDMKDAGIASIAWMVIMGDGMHNFSDGLAIGAAFSANLTGGISTSVAVFCHELPHELGDFAVLINAGMSVKQAIVYNVLSALMAYVGMLIGTAVGQYTHNLTSWIFAVTAGMFLYVALVDMLPEMLHGDSEEHKRCHLGHFVLQNVGLLTGFTIMLLIAIFEDRIVFDFGF